jgi:predicted permease
LRTLLQDLRYAVRMLAKSPGLSTVAILTLALGIGANTAIFSMVNALFLQPLPFPKAESIVMVWADHPSPPVDCHQLPPQPRDLREWMDQGSVFEHLAATRGLSMTLEAGGEAERIAGVDATAGLFPALGVQPVLGRVFTDDEDRPGASRVVVISYGLWQRRFGGDPSVVGRLVRLDKQDWTVVGIMPRGFRFPSAAGMPFIYAIDRSTDFWRPLAFSPDDWSRGGHRNLMPVGRLKDGITIEQAQAVMTATARRQEQERPDTNKDFTIRVEPLRRQVASGVRPVLMLSCVAVGVVLLIACANVASLLLSRSAVRRHEIAVRAALGAGGGRIMRQLLIESGLLAGLGSAAGLLLARWLVGVVRVLAPVEVPRIDQAGMDVTTVAFTVAVAVVVGALCGLAPAFSATRVDVTAHLRGAQRQGNRTSHQRSRELFSVGQIALATTLMFGAVLLARSYSKLIAVDPGFRKEGALASDLWLGGYGPADRVATLDRLRVAVDGLPGVASSGVVTALPLEGGSNLDRFFVEGQAPIPRGSEPAAAVPAVTPGYFDAIGIPLLRGRYLQKEDVSGKPLVAVVSRGVVARFFHGTDPLGKRLKLGYWDGNQPWMTIVGVVGDVKGGSLSAETPLHVYLPYAQRPFPTATLVLRTTRSLDSLATELRAAAKATDSSLAMANIRTIESVASRAAAHQRFHTLVLGLFTAIAILLTGIGLYGVVTSWTVQRTREFGIRMALGARARDVLITVLHRSILLTLAGIGIGMTGALFLVRTLRSLVFGVSGTDAISILAVACFVVTVSMIAACLPARRAAKVDPMVALRCE